jgi:hypothetical protein
VNFGFRKHYVGALERAASKKDKERDEAVGGSSTADFFQVLKVMDCFGYSHVILSIKFVSLQNKAEPRNGSGRID